MGGRLASLLVAFSLVASVASAADETQAFLSQAAGANRFQLAAGNLAVRKTQAAVVHGDLFRDNVLWAPAVAGGTGPKIGALLDFESASRGHVAFDLMVGAAAVLWSCCRT